MDRAEEFEHLKNWSGTVDKLVAVGDLDGAISLLESVVSRLEKTPYTAIDYLLSSAQIELKNLYLAKRQSWTPFPSNAKEIHPVRAVDPGVYPLSSSEEERSSSLEENADANRLPVVDDWEDLADCSPSELLPNVNSTENISKEQENNGFDTSPVDDWEILADLPPNELMLPTAPNHSKLISDKEIFSPHRRRGRGTFFYNRNELYSEKFHDLTLESNEENENEINVPCKRSTKHILVLHDLPKTTTTMDLEKHLTNFEGRVAIRWVNDTTALAVFTTSTTAFEAAQQIIAPFKTKILSEDDPLMNSIPAGDLDPPRARPRTSTRTAQRLIAHGIGLKLGGDNLISREQRIKEEEARRSRIVERQRQIDDAWGSE